MKESIIFADHSATTSVRPEVLEEMLPYFSIKYGNPSSLYKSGRESKDAAENAREQIAGALNAKPDEIYFTSSGSEANNWFIKGAADMFKDKGNHIITSSIEHPAVLEPCKFLEKSGFKVTYLPVDENGIVDPDDVKNAITGETILISVMFANNEIGSIQPVKEIGEIAKENGIYFHTDAVQAVGNIDINVKNLNIDALTMSAHKFYGPKGIGALYLKKGIDISNLIHGGHQEHGKRAATENVPGIVGIGKAIELASGQTEEYSRKLISLRDRTIEGIFNRIPYVKLNGDRYRRLPGHVNFSFEFIEGAALLILLDKENIFCSSGSACSSGSSEPSHVLKAIGLSDEIAYGAVRITYGIENNEEDVDRILDVLECSVQKLREMSPYWRRNGE